MMKEILIKISNKGPLNFTGKSCFYSLENIPMFSHGVKMTKLLLTVNATSRVRWVDNYSFVQKFPSSFETFTCKNWVFN